MKRVAFVSTNYFVPWGGSEELWSHSAKRMAELGYRVGINVGYWRDEARQITELSKTNGCEVYRSKIKPSLWRRIANKLLSEQVQAYIDFDVYGWLKRFQPNLAVISSGLNTQSRDWMQACSKLNIPYVTIIHLADEALWPYPNEVNNNPYLFKKAASVFFVSKGNLEITSKQLAMNFENARIARNPFKVKYDNHIPWPGDDSAFRLACVARFGIEHKRQDIILEIMRQPKWRNRPITITLFGDGYHKESLQKLKEYWEVDNVIFGGFSKDIEAVWSAHHALVLPSRYEGLPLAVVEAMLCCRPCIVTDVGGNSELIEDGVSGFLAPAATTPLFERTLEQAWERRHDWKQIGENAGRRVREVIPCDPVGNFVEQLRAFI